MRVSVKKEREKKRRGKIEGSRKKRKGAVGEVAATVARPICILTMSFKENLSP